MNRHSAIKFARDHRERSVSELKAFVSIPSVSAQPGHAADVKRCAAWLAAQLRRVGMPLVKLVQTPRHPIVYAAWTQAKRRPTVLIYGHYDVQPADPVSEWRTAPFAPTVRNNNLYGRGASDDKGQLFVHLKVLESFLATERALPVNIKCIFEGEEEIGSPNLIPLLRRNSDALKADVAVMSDTRMLGPSRPAITYALRGTAAFELEVFGPGHDLHSGNFGGAVHDPLQALCEIVATLHDQDHRIIIPGFYDKVRRWSNDERSRMAHTGPKDSEILHDAEATYPWGEADYTLYERTTVRPALTVNGISGGYEGTGLKGVIPARGLVKLSFRLVPDQDPTEIARLFREHVSRVTPPTVRSVVRVLNLAKPTLINPRHPGIQAAAEAYRKGFGSLPVMLRSGGTIPVTSAFQEILRIPTVLMGFALPDDNMHAPNEKFYLPNFYRGIETGIHFLAGLQNRLAPGRAGLFSTVQSLALNGVHHDH